MDMTRVVDGGSFIANWTDAAITLAQWVRAHGHMRRGILDAIVSGLQTKLAIEEGAPDRYSQETREDTRSAIEYLTRADWSEPAVCAANYQAIA